MTVENSINVVDLLGQGHDRLRVDVNFLKSVDRR